MNPQLKLAKFKVSLNRNTVKRLYFDITKSDSNRQYQNLLISFKISTPIEMSNTSSILSENINLIKRAVVEKWVSWFEAEYKEIFNNFILTDESQERRLNQYIYSPPGSVNIVDMSMVKTVEETPELTESEAVEGEISSNTEAADMVDQTPAKIVSTESNNEMNMFKDSQWLLVKVRISDLEIDDNFKKMSFKISGGHLFFDLNSREVILSNDYKAKTNVLSYREQDSFSSSVGTRLFNLPLNDFIAGKKVFTKAPQINNQAQIKIQNVRFPEQIIGLSDFLNLGGDSVNLKVSSFDIIEGGALITVNFFGELSNLKNKFVSGRIKVLPDTRWHFYAEDDQLNVELIPEVIDGQEIAQMINLLMKIQFNLGINMKSFKFLMTVSIIFIITQGCSMGVMKRNSNLTKRSRCCQTRVFYSQETCFTANS